MRKLLASLLASMDVTSKPKIQTIDPVPIELLQRLQQIPIMDYLVLLTTVLLLLLGIWGIRLARRKRLSGKTSPEEAGIPVTFSTRLGRLGVRILRLAGFGILAVPHNLLQAC
jgi:hypothetical protein